MIVLDASAWIDVLTAGLDLPELGDDDLSVPPHFDVEVLGSIRALEQRAAIEGDQALDALERHMRGTFDRVFEPADVRTAWTLRESMSFRDAWYVALAKRLDARWVTGDRKAARTAQRLGVATHVT